VLFLYILPFYFLLLTFCYVGLFVLYSTGRDRRGRDCMVVGYTTTYAISSYHHWCCEFES